jgi:hypothetical protein
MYRLAVMPGVDHVLPDEGIPVVHSSDAYGSLFTVVAPPLTYRKLRKNYSSFKMTLLLILKGAVVEARGDEHPG